MKIPDAETPPERIMRLAIQRLKAMDIRPKCDNHAPRCVTGPYLGWQRVECPNCGFTMFYNDQLDNDK